VNQDKIGVQATRVKQEIYAGGKKDYWAGKLSGDRYVVILFNREIKAADFSFSLTIDLKLPANLYVTVRDIINHKDLGLFHSDILSFPSIPARSVKALVLSLIPQKELIEE
jgi:hypothetical protein